jgi:hypothetical protein
MCGSVEMTALLAVLAVLAALMELLKARAVLRRGAVISDAFSYLRAAREVRKGRPLSECLSFFCPGRPEALNLPPLQVLAVAPLARFGQAALRVKVVPVRSTIQR